MDLLKDWLLAVVASEGSTFAGRGNILLIIFVVILHRTESLFAWAGRHITVRLGSWFRWDGPQPSMRKASLANDLAVVIFFFLACAVTLAYVESRGSAN